jgi:hypothetical protein
MARVTAQRPEQTRLREIIASGRRCAEVDGFDRLCVRTRAARLKFLSLKGDVVIHARPSLEVLSLCLLWIVLDLGGDIHAMASLKSCLHFAVERCAWQVEANSLRA